MFACVFVQVSSWKYPNASIHVDSRYFASQPHIHYVPSDLVGLLLWCPGEVSLDVIDDVITVYVMIIMPSVTNQYFSATWFGVNIQMSFVESTEGLHLKGGGGGVINTALIRNNIVHVLLTNTSQKMVFFQHNTLTWRVVLLWTYCFCGIWTQL